MTERGRALLINTLVFPGMGQLLILERRVSGGLLVGVSAAALLALCVVLGLRLGDVLATPDLGPFEMLSSMLDVLKAPGVGVLSCIAVLGACWVLSVVDALVAARAESGAQR